jgi:hypothetical protein
LVAIWGHVVRHVRPFAPHSAAVCRDVRVRR